jgi:hypothetical protein
MLAKAKKALPTYRPQILNNFLPLKNTRLTSGHFEKKLFSRKTIPTLALPRLSSEGREAVAEWQAVIVPDHDGGRRK